MTTYMLMDKFIIGGCETMLKNITDDLLLDNHEVKLILYEKSSIENSNLDILNKKVKIEYIWKTEIKSRVIKRIRYWITLFFPKLVSLKLHIERNSNIVVFKDIPFIAAIGLNLRGFRTIWIQNTSFEVQKSEVIGIKELCVKTIDNYFNKRFFNCLNLFDNIVCVSRYSEKEIKELNHKVRNIILVNNYVQEKMILELGDELIDEPNEIKSDSFYYIGRLAEEKGVLRLIEAIEILKRNNILINLNIIGEGELYNVCNELIKQLNIENQIHLLGAKRNPFPYLKNARALIIPSYRESFGLVILEAFALSIPVICTRSGGPEEILGDDYFGKLADNSLQGLVEAIQNFVEDESLAALYKSRVKEALIRYSRETQMKIIKRLLNLDKE